jgi:hypothetical protein
MPTVQFNPDLSVYPLLYRLQVNTKEYEIPRQ